MSPLREQETRVGLALSWSDAEGVGVTFQKPDGRYGLGLPP